MTTATPHHPELAREVSRIIIKPLNVAPVAADGKTPTAKQSNAASSEAPALIVLGRDDAGKPHASWFGDADIATATAAAHLMGMVAIPVDKPELGALAAKLPQGRVFASGKAFVPFVKRELFEELAGHVSDDQRKALEAGGKAKPAAVTSPADASTASSGAETASYTLPEDWSKITVNSLVLAYDGDDASWFEAAVVETKGADQVVLRWRDWPDLPNFVRRRQELALMHPSYAADGVAR